MKKCELCNSTAKMYCDSDQASLCWDCDARVHTANFLVAKHLRTLLCHSCQSPTPWTASGPKLGSTVSVCQACANRSSSSVDHGYQDSENSGENDEHEDEEEEDDRDDSEDDDQDDNDDSSDTTSTGDEDDGDNQVVPLSSAPLISSSSSTEDSSKRSSERRDGGFSNSRIGFFSNHSNENGRFSYDGIQRSRQKGIYRISSPTSR